MIDTSTASGLAALAIMFIVIILGGLVVIQDYLDRKRKQRHKRA